MFLERVAARVGEENHLPHRHAAMRGGMVKNAHGEIRQGGQRDFFAVDLDLQMLHLLLHGAEEISQPRLPIWRIGANRPLRLPERRVVAFLAPFDEALQRTVRHIRV